MNKKLILSLSAATLIYFGLRFLLLISNFDDMSIPPFELFPMGTMAKNIIDGSGYPIMGYCDTHSGGELITGFGAIPFYLLMGQSYMALKMTPLFTGLGVLLLLFFFLKSNFSSRAAILGAFLFALAPTTLVKHSLLAMGNHFEILFPLTVLLFCFYRFHFQIQTKRWLALSAIVAGFCIFHNFSSMIVIALLCVVHFGMRGYIKTLQDLLLVVPFAIIGLLPLILINLGTEGGGGVFLEAKFMGKNTLSLSILWARLLDFFGTHFIQVGCFKDFAGIPGKLAEWSWLVCFMLAYLSATPCFLKGVRIIFCRLLGRSLSDSSSSVGDEATNESCSGDRSSVSPAKLECLKIMPLLLYLPCLALAYSAGNFKLGGYADSIKVGGYRYFLTHILFALFLIAIQASRISLTRKGKRLRLAGGVFCGVALITGLFNLAEADLTFSNPKSHGLRYNGYSYFQSSRGMFTNRIKKDENLIAQSMNNMAPLYKSQIYWGVGYLYAMIDLRPTVPKRGKNKGRSNLSGITINKVLSKTPKEHRIDAAYGLGEYLREMYSVRTLRMNTLKEFIQRNAGIYTPYVLQGMMARRTFIKTQQLKNYFNSCERFISRSPKSFTPDLILGYGMQCGYILRRGIQQEFEIIKNIALMIPEKYQNMFYYGLGMGYALANYPLASPTDLIEESSSVACYYMRAGFGAVLRKTFGQGADLNELQAMDPQPPAEAMEAIKAGMAWDNYPVMRNRSFFQ